MPDKRGYYKKFTVIDNRTGVEYMGRTFTFKVDEDPRARVALLVYANAVRQENPALAADIDAMFKEGK
jgi:hypothetical protein